VSALRIVNLKRRGGGGGGRNPVPVVSGADGLGGGGLESLRVIERESYESRL
jgi:hypothetical protein